MKRDNWGLTILIISIVLCIIYLFLWAIPSGSPDLYFTTLYLFAPPIIGALLYMKKFGKTAPEKDETT